MHRRLLSASDYEKVSCPYCLADPGEQCATPGGAKRSRVHSLRRKKLVKELQGEQRRLET